MIDLCCSGYAQSVAVATLTRILTQAVVVVMFAVVVMF
jgi:hypothetical protein